MSPDYERAARLATETLISNQVSFAPIAPLPILKSMPGVIVLPFAEVAQLLGIERERAVTMFGDENHDAVTNLREVDGEVRYMVSYNQLLPTFLVQRALARELGHIVLGHDGSRPLDVRNMEATCFAQHFLCPRALIKGIEQAGVQLTTEVVGNITGCYERCLAGMRKTPGTHVPASLNRQVKAQFGSYIQNLVDVQNILKKDDESMFANFGTYMDGYQE